MKLISNFRPEKHHFELGPAFFDEVAPAQFPQHILRYRNQSWAERVGLGGLADDQWVKHFGQFLPLEGSFETPLALRYHGHQFRSYNADLGDGRGFLFAQMRDDKGRLLDLGTKGSGRTPWSRGGDGRLTLKGGVREVLATEMLEAMGVNTSKSFSLVETGEELIRGDEPSPTRSAVLVRVSHSHIRIGTFQRLAYLQDDENIRRLADYVVEHYYPDAKREDEAGQAAALLQAVAAQVAETGAQWIAAGFVHGVLNTDNINITGESFDYGPWRFVPTYDPNFTAAYFDETGLYAFGRQPDTLAWNLTRFAECLLPLADAEQLEPALNSFWPAFRAALPRSFLRRLGLTSRGEAENQALITALLQFLGASQMPFEQAMFDLYGGLARLGKARQGPVAGFYAGAEFDALLKLLKQYEMAANAQTQHAYFHRDRPRSMLIDEMEAIWTPIAEDDDWSAFERVLAEIAQMREAYGCAR